MNLKNLILNQIFNLDVTTKGLENLPYDKGALLLGNHVSFIDWLILAAKLPKNTYFVLDEKQYEPFYLKILLKTINIISFKELDKISKFLDEKNYVVMFPEVHISKNGHLGVFKKDFEEVLKNCTTDISVIPFYIRGMWETTFSNANKKYKSLNKKRHPSVYFGENIQNADVVNVKKAIKNISIDSWINYIDKLDTIPELIFDRLKKQKSKLVFADSTGVELSGYKFLTASILFKNLLKYKLDSQNIGILLPTSCAAAFINTTVLMLGKTAVNLNFTASKESLKKSLEKANINSIITSEKFISKLKEKGIDVDYILDSAEVLYLEKLKTNISKIDGLKTLLSVILTPTSILKKQHISKVKQTETALIMFSSGSEGIPKGIELTHKNVVGNCKQFSSIINMNDEDIIVGSLPFFHAFGTAVTLFYPLIEGIKCVAHPDPTDGYNIGKLVEKYKATILLGTSTFLRLYVKNPKMTKEMLSSIRLSIAGAEKLSSQVRNEFKNKFELDIYEGYGVTETTPVASCNIPNIKHSDGSIQIGNKIGTVGMPIPGTKFKIINPQTKEELKPNQEGMVLIGGVQVMKGYLKDESKTSEVLLNLNEKTWYVTGDKGRVDEDGFLTIVDRYSRFAKLGGEMISLTLVEEKIKDLVKNELTDLVVTSLSDEKKGEKIICMITNISDDELTILKQDIINNFDSKLMIPSSYKIIEAVPKLGSGKTDFSATKKLADELS